MVTFRELSFVSMVLFLLLFTAVSIAATDISGIKVTSWTCPKPEDLILTYKEKGQGYTISGQMHNSLGESLGLKQLLGRGNPLGLLYGTKDHPPKIKYAFLDIKTGKYTISNEPSIFYFLAGNKNMNIYSESEANSFSAVCAYLAVYEKPPINISSSEFGMLGDSYGPKFVTLNTQPETYGIPIVMLSYRSFGSSCEILPDACQNYQLGPATKYSFESQSCTGSKASLECQSMVFLKNPPGQKYNIVNNKTGHCLIATGPEDATYPASWLEQKGVESGNKYSLPNTVIAPVVMAYAGNCDKEPRAQWVISSGSVGPYNTVQFQNVATKRILYQLGDYKIWAPGQDAWQQKGVVSLSTNPIVATVSPAVIANPTFAPRSQWYLNATGTEDDQYNLGTDPEGKINSSKGLQQKQAQEIGVQMYNLIKAGKLPSSPPEILTDFINGLSDKEKAAYTKDKVTFFADTGHQLAYGNYVYQKEKNNKSSPLGLGLVMMDTNLPVTTAYEGAGSKVYGMVAGVLSEAQQNSQIKSLCYGSKPCTAVVSDWPSIGALEGDFTVPLLLSQSWRLVKVNN